MSCGVDFIKLEFAYLFCFRLTCMLACMSICLCFLLACFLSCRLFLICCARVMPSSWHVSVDPDLSVHEVQVVFLPRTPPSPSRVFLVQACPTRSTARMVQLRVCARSPSMFRVSCSVSAMHVSNSMAPRITATVAPAAVLCSSEWHARRISVGTARRGPSTTQRSHR